MHGRWSTIHRLKHDIQTPYTVHDTRYTIHTPNEHELNTHRIMVPGLENDQSASGARSSATASTRAGPVRAEASPPSAYGTSSNQCMSLLLSCFFTFCVLRFAFSGSLIPPFLHPASYFVLRASVLLPFYFLRNLPTYKQTNQTKLTSPSSPLPFPPYTNLTETNTSRAPSGTTSREDTARSRSASARWSACSTRCTPSSLHMRMRRRACSRLCRGWVWVWGRG